ncbi:P-loop containing nucleoside triphosphate hydrolase protein [Rhizoctonia solani]|uniref:P-loop containing nucleoside triphosphate hydrolase protein n=1 Tax=Rhizoctonia solani TaxID=456999 RepID=A0A8H7IN93_9AGAM|nr:P-loop containing nucleoside triphosphate hydrolase protein [Rhizoctonia solani]KAF8760037.1 P-loop containing nucleoside triphosphate hydrolase protein [Rhizoctonia solani]
MDTSLFTRPFTYLPTRPKQPNPRVDSPLEEHFINITLDDTYDALGARHHRGNVNIVIATLSTTMLRDKYPDHSLVVTEDWQVDVLNLEGVAWKPLDGVELQTHVTFIAPTRRNQTGQVARSIRFGGFDVWWKEERFTVFVASVSRDSLTLVLVNLNQKSCQWPSGFGLTTQHFILKEGKDETASLGLLMAAGYQSGQIGNSVLVFNNGFWQNDYDLWEEVQKADWKDVILSPDFKQQIQSDVKNFFASEAVYHDLGVPWKRGTIFLGPPGNGKTISIKALMKSSQKPALYVKSFRSWMGEEGSMREVFNRARREAPCLLILEDLDALINDENRSFFLNEIDGLENNDGLYILGTTNHFERLDPGLSDRPSRFDRKYTFALPNRDERVQYAQYWQRKLKDNKDVSFPDSLVEKVADLTSGFSFAYLKEAFVSTLVSMVGAHDVQFEKVLVKQILELKKQIGNSDVMPILGTTYSF